MKGRQLVTKLYNKNNLKYIEGFFITECLNKMQSVINQLPFMKMMLGNEMQVLLLFSFLVDIQKILVVSNSISDGVITMSLGINSLRNEELRRNAFDPHILRHLS